VTETAADSTNAIQQSESGWESSVHSKEGKGDERGEREPITRDFLAK
jgi:hypothetical protein